MTTAGMVLLQGAGRTSGQVFQSALKHMLPSPKTARVVVSTAALAEVPGVVARFAGWFSSRGFRGAEVTRVALPGEPGAMSSDEAQATLRAANLIFLAGGDPVVGAEVLSSSGADTWLREARQSGVHLAGGSAGAILLGAWWARWPSELPSDAPFDGGELVACSGVVPLVVDTHAEDDDWGELHLIDGMLTAAGKRGEVSLWGIPTHGALLIDSDGKIEELGDASFRL